MLRTRTWMLALTGMALAAAPLAAQGHQHTPGMTHQAGTGDPPAESGQAAFAAISEIVARLDADPATDWSEVSVERLRQHLIDMDHVTLRSRVSQREAPGGFTAEVTGEGEVVGSIRRMLAAHAAQMTGEGAIRATVEEIAGGVRLTVTAVAPAGAGAVARLRGLGAIGFLALGGHHGPHHEGIARGTMVH